MASLRKVQTQIIEKVIYAYFAVLKKPSLAALLPVALGALHEVSPTLCDSVKQYSGYYSLTTGNNAEMVEAGSGFKIDAQTPRK